MVPPTKMPPRAPFGPSLVLMAGMPFEGIALVLQKSAAVRRDTLPSQTTLSKEISGLLTFSSRVSRASFVLATSRASSITALFGIGLNSGEYSVPGVVLLSSDILGPNPSSYWCDSTCSILAVNVSPCFRKSSRGGCVEGGFGNSLDYVLTVLNLKHESGPFGPEGNSSVRVLSGLG